MTIYFAEMGDWIKIGFTAAEDASGRIKQLQTGQPQRINLLGTIPGERDAETGLHEEFAEFRGNGEWFKRDAELTSTIKFLVENQKHWYFSRIRVRIGKIWKDAFELKGDVDRSAYDDCVRPPHRDPRVIISNRINARRQKHGKSLEWEEKVKKNILDKLVPAYVKAWEQFAELSKANPFGDYSKYFAH